MSNRQNIKLHILGAGPAGLATGYYAKKKNITLQLYEGSDRVGGNCKTFVNGNYRFDTGAHRFHDKHDQVTADIQKLLGDELIKVSVPSKIFRNNLHIEFPLNLIDLLYKLDFFSLLRISYENIINRIKYDFHPENFKDLAYQTYGRTLSEFFLINYTKKLWGEDADSLHISISGDRLKNLDLFSVIKQFIGGKNSRKHLDGSFYYPKFGFGTIFDRTRDFIGSENVKLNSPVKELVHEYGKIKQIVYGNNHVADVEMVVNSLPINIVVRMLNPSPPKNILDIVDSLRYRHLKLCICYLDVPHFSENASIYFSEEKFPFTRIYEPKNRSSEMAPKEKTCIVIEIPFSPGDKIHVQSDIKLFEEISSLLVENKLIEMEKIIDYHFINIDYAYPIITCDIDKKIDTVFSYLNSIKNLSHIGRGAEFRYLHTHTIFYNAQKLINQLIL